MFLQKLEGGAFQIRPIRCSPAEPVTGALDEQIHRINAGGLEFLDQPPRMHNGNGLIRRTVIREHGRVVGRYGAEG